MKYFRLLLILLLLFSDLPAQTIGDTLYCNKNVNQFIFIEKPNSAFHDSVFNYLLGDRNSKRVIKNPSDTKKQVINSLMGQWISLVAFKGRYYAYHPSEPFFNTFLLIADRSLITNDFNDGFVTLAIERSNENKRNRMNLLEKNGFRHYVDFEEMFNGIFIVRSSLWKGRKIYFVRKEHFYDFPIIVNYCPHNRCPEINEVVK